MSVQFYRNQKKYMRHKNSHNHSSIQLYGLVTLRLLIGWYFLYEGLAKVFTPKWTAYGYLMDSQGVFALSSERLLRIRSDGSCRFYQYMGSYPGRHTPDHRFV